MRVAHVILSWGALTVPAVCLSTLVATRCAAPSAVPQIAAPQPPAPQTSAPQTPAPMTPAPQTPAPQTPEPQTPEPQTPVVRPPTPPTASGEADAVRLAVFRYLIGHNASGGQSHVPFVCLEVHQGDGVHDPSSSVLALMHGTTPRVVPGTTCEHGPDGVFLKRDHARGRGLVFRTAEVTIDGDKATVEGGYYEAGLSASGNTYTVERQRDGSWRVTRDVMNWIS